MKYKKKRLKDLKERRLKRKKNEQGRYIWSDHLTMQNVFEIHFNFISRILRALITLFTSNEVFQYQKHYLIYFKYGLLYFWFMGQVSFKCATRCLYWNLD